MEMALGESIIVTGSRAPAAIMAEQEALGDLKLYRIPEPVTVAANSQRQVALLERSDVPIVIVYRQDVGSEGREGRSEEQTYELQSIMRISYAVFCLKKKNQA